MIRRKQVFTSIKRSLESVKGVINMLWSLLQMDTSNKMQSRGNLGVEISASLLSKVKSPLQVIGGDVEEGLGAQGKHRGGTGIIR